MLNARLLIIVLTLSFNVESAYIKDLKKIIPVPVSVYINKSNNTSLEIINIDSSMVASFNLTEKKFDNLKYPFELKSSKSSGKYTLSLIHSLHQCTSFRSSFLIPVNIKFNGKYIENQNKLDFNWDDGDNALSLELIFDEIKEFGNEKYDCSGTVSIMVTSKNV
ncbi:hypothetical protein [Vibrio sagamiensis]|uniref:Uncharacterized protein n=1 Tax=Vibrio sagamiensis NBRC 104589 TaxID=1219064 RepID=A0A511QHV7_9VIBR|nr:hypothetical protein [Vibrio sagamiensis]GEM76767.1 hypothetical protein VSA01S_28790 [Vibrio sagamiensis NBRC 104589]